MPLASPKVTTTYKVTITDGNGNSFTQELTVNVVDVHCGEKGDKGDPGPKGDKGDPGPAGNANNQLRVIALGVDQCGTSGCTVTCEAGEVIASAVCAADSPLQPTIEASAAKCGPAKAMNAICARK